MRGNPQDYDNWASLTGDDQWKYDNLLPYFKKMEHYEGHFPSGNKNHIQITLYSNNLDFLPPEEYHGSSGPLRVSRQSFEPQMEDWVQSGEDVGLKKSDPNARQTSGKLLTIILSV